MSPCKLEVNSQPREERKTSNMTKQENDCVTKVTRGRDLDQERIDINNAGPSLENDTCEKQRKSKIRKHTKRRYQCEICCQNFTVKRDLECHMKYIHGGRRYTCEHCKYKTNRKGTLKEHIFRKHSDNYNYICGICGKKYKTKDSLREHMQYKHEEQSIKCEVINCGHISKNWMSHKRHEMNMHSNLNSFCHICKKHLSKKYFTQHMRNHNKGTFICPFKKCDKAFKQKKGMQQHFLLHMGKKLYICDICNKSFAQYDGLRQHRRELHPGPVRPIPAIDIDDKIKRYLEECSKEVGE